MQLIDKWLKESKNFFIGVSIYRSSGRTSPELLALFAKGKTPFAEVKLLEALTEMIAQPAIIEPPPAAIETDTMPETKDAVLAGIRNEWLPLYQRMNYLRHSLDKHTGNTPAIIEIRKPIAVEILSLEKECMQVWDKRHYYLQHGKLPYVESVEENPIPENPVDLGRFIENCKKGIRRNRKLMHEHKDKPKYAQLYNEYKALYLKATGEEYKEKEV